MIRQLPKLSLPSFIQKYTGEALEEVHSHTNATDVKIYDMITASTVNNSEGNTMQLQLFQKDSEINEGVRELHGRITLNTENLPDKQDLNFGFMFTDSQSGSKYDGLQVLTRVHHEFNEGRKQKFAHIDVSSTSKPDIYDVDIQRDSQHDWVILEDESSVTCEDVGRCEFSVAFVRNFDTMDTKQDIAFQEGEEHEYAFTGFYRAKSIANGDITHIGQSQEMFILCGALNVLTSTTLAVASAVIALTAF